MNILGVERKNKALPKIKEEDYPDVDVFVATINENEKVLTTTIEACKNMKYPDKKKVNIYANKLKSYGLEKGDSISLLLCNTPEVVYYYYAAWVLGVKVCPLDPRTNADGIKDMINRCHCKLLVAILDKYQDKVSPIINKINVDKIVIVSPTDEMGYSIKGTIGKALYKHKEHQLNLVDKDFASDKIIMNKKFLKGVTDTKVPSVYEETKYGMPAACLFTSGTTGTPKAAVHSHEAYNAKAKQIVYTIPNVDRGESFLGIIPFFSAYGSFAGMHNCLYRAVNIIMIPQFKPSEVPELILETKPTVVIAVPNYWHDFGTRIDELMAKYNLKDLSFLRYPISGGDKQPAQDIELLNNVLKKYDSDAVLYRGYGATEVGGPIASTVYESEYEDGEYTGVLYPGTDYRFYSSESGLILPEGTTNGEIMISDPSVIVEYLDDEEETKKSIEELDGKRYMKMGDIASVDDMGRVHFYGRTKRAMMRPDGHTVHALPIEEAIETSYIVDQCCVVGIKKNDGSTGTIPTAFVVLKNNKEGSQEIAQELDKISLEQLSERNRALQYVFVKQLPRTLMDKVDYKALEKLNMDDLVRYVVDDVFFKFDAKTNAKSKALKK
jgi:long-chain acyl-CoA synthetase